MRHAQPFGRDDVSPPEQDVEIDGPRRPPATIDPAEVAGGVRALRKAMVPVASKAPERLVDTAGTGGGTVTTFNISTAAALVVAGAGVPVAKHGNRSFTSKCGSADVLEALGVRIDLTPERMGEVLEEAGIVFMFAPLLHPAMKHVGPVRRDLGFRTVFNLLGPICNPAGVRRQLIGIYAREWLEPVAHVLADLGTEKAWIVHGSDGLDELSTTGPTRVAMLESGQVAVRDIVPEDVGMPRATLAALKGGTAEDNACAIRDLLGGTKSAFRDIVLLNSAAALVVAGIASDLRDGVARAAEAIDTGRAASALEQARAQRNAK